jgi:hypothetical protein
MAVCPLLPAAFEPPLAGFWQGLLAAICRTLGIPGQLHIRFYLSMRDLQIAIVIIISGDEIYDQ